jgi:hypothetical protein
VSPKQKLNVQQCLNIDNNSAHNVSGDVRRAFMPQFVAQRVSFRADDDDTITTLGIPMQAEAAGCC